MVKHQLASPSIPDLDETDVGATSITLMASATRGWQGVGAYHYEVRTQPTFIAVPESITAQVHTVVLQLSGVVKLRRRITQRIHETISHASSLCLMPLACDVAWSWIGTAQLLHMYLTPELVASVADEVGRTDPERPGFGEHFDARDPFIHQIGQMFISELYTEQYGGRLYAESLGATLALHLLRNYADFSVVHTPSPRGLVQPHLCRVLDYINDHLSQEISLTELAAVVHLSPSYFLRQFKAATGLAPHQYLIQQRVAKAKLLLLDSPYSIAEIAQIVGFSDHSHLHRHFKRVFGVAPRDVLQERKNIHIQGETIQDTLL